MPDNFVAQEETGAYARFLFFGDNLFFLMEIVKNGQEKSKGKKTRIQTPGLPTKGQDHTEALARIERELADIVGPALAAEGLELVAVQYRGESAGRVLRIYVDRQGGVSLDDCAFASRHIGDLLDVYFTTDSSYNLEVSSPGSDRPLVTEEHYNRFAGQRAEVRTREKLLGRAKFTGDIVGAKDGVLTITVDNQTTAIPISAIARAKLSPPIRRG